MPRSCSLLRQDTRKYLLDNYDKDSTILDVGPGEGTYYNLLNDYFTNMDAVEVWEPYINQYNLRNKSREKKSYEAMLKGLKKRT